jgi:protein TonB
MGIFFPNCGVPTGRSGGQGLFFAAVAAAHVAILGLLAVAVPSERLAELARPIAVRLIELAPEVPTPPRPKPPPPLPKPPPPRPKPATPVLAVASPVEPPVTASFTVAPQPPAPVPEPAIVAAPAPAPALIDARFDADYLDNPKPLYPHASRRLGEEGKVVLRVFVSAEGDAKQVEVKRSSGFQRLDLAAEKAVARWRFVPARRGEQAVTAWVVVPIVFSLDNES